MWSNFVVVTSDITAMADYVCLIASYTGKLFCLTQNAPSLYHLLRNVAQIFHRLDAISAVHQNSVKALKGTESTNPEPEKSTECGLVLSASITGLQGRLEFGLGGQLPLNG